MSNAFAKIQKWLETRRTRRKDRDAEKARTMPRSKTAEELSRQSSTGTEVSSTKVEIMPLPDSPGRKRRSLSLTRANTGDQTPPRERSRSWGAAERLRRSLRRKKGHHGEETSGSIRCSSTLTSHRIEVLAVGQPQDGRVRTMGGEVIELSDEVLTGPLQRESYLQKNGRLIGGWKRRWFVLDRSDIAIYKNDSCNTLTGIIAVALVENILYPATADSFGFTFEIVTSKRNYVLAAKSEEEALSWVHLIRRAIYRGERVSVMTPKTPRKVVDERSSICPSLLDVSPEDRTRLTEGIANSADLKIAAIDELHAFLDDQPLVNTGMSSQPADDDKTKTVVEELVDYLRAH